MPEFDKADGASAATEQAEKRTEEVLSELSVRGRIASFLIS